MVGKLKFEAERSLLEGIPRYSLSNLVMSDKVL